MNNDPSNKRLNDEENYKTTFSLNDLDSSLLTYSKLISGFIKDVSEDINIAELNQFMFVLEKGVETIANVYKTILLYTRNIELTEYYTEKAGIYYIEFISQIIGSEINIRECLLFVYKKTIFEINNECKKRVVISAEQNVYFTILDEYVLFFYTFIKSVLSERNVKENKCIMAGILNEKAIDYSRKLNFSNDLTHVRLEKLKFLNSLISGLSILKCSHIRIFNILDAILKKMMKIDTSEDCDIRFSMEKLTNAFENNYSPLKTASHLLLM
jgi:hypothetical protein